MLVLFLRYTPTFRKACNDYGAREKGHDTHMSDVLQNKSCNVVGNVEMCVRAHVNSPCGCGAAGNLTHAGVKNNLPPSCTPSHV